MFTHFHSAIATSQETHLNLPMAAMARAVEANMVLPREQFPMWSMQIAIRKGKG